MKIELVKINGEVVGYDMTPESYDDKLTLGSLRSLHFYGFEDTYIRYNGIESEVSETGGNLVTKMKFIQQKHEKH